MQSGVEKVERIVHKGSGSGELAFFFGLRHLGILFVIYLLYHSILLIKKGYI